MKFKQIFTFIIIAILSLACSPEDKLIDNTTNKFSLLLTTTEINNPVKLLSFPENVVTENDNTAKINAVLNGKTIKKTKYYLDKIYFIIEEEASIYVFNSDTYEYLDKYVFDQSRTPVDIAFSNATDAYVLYKNKSPLTVVQNNIGLLDIYFNKYIKDINLEFPSDISSIASHTNMLYLGFNDKTIGKFDVRDYKLKATSKVRSNCNLISVTPNNDILFVLDGDSTNNVKSSVIFVNQTDFTNQKELVLDLFEINSNTLIPISLVNSPKEYIFFSTNQGFIRLDSRSKGYPYFVSGDNYSLCRYIERNSSLMLIKSSTNGSQIDFADNETGEIRNSYNLNYRINSILSYN